LTVELIELVHIAICVGPVALTRAVIVHTNMRLRGSGNRSSKRSNVAVLSRKTILSRVK
jgi:hypothetical protein